MEKLTIYIGLTIGGIIGGYLPVVLFHVSSFSWVSLICGFVGCIAGAWLGWKLTLWVGEWLLPAPADRPATAAGRLPAASSSPRGMPIPMR